jgi:hypothetical protein
VLKTFYKKESANEFLFIFSNRGLKGLLKKARGLQKKRKRKQGTKKQSQKNNRPTFFFFFFRCPLRRLWAVCGHATACGHPQLAAVSSFMS